jgi:hypothetical protein
MAADFEIGVSYQQSAGCSRDFDGSLCLTQDKLKAFEELMD